MNIAVTGGHFSPAWAVIAALLRRGHRIIYFGRKTSMEGDSSPSIEYLTLKEKDVTFVPLVTARLGRHVSIRTMFSLCKFPVGFVQAGMTLFSARPDVVVAFGGALAVPVVASAWILRIPIILHEQTAAPGLANRFLAHVADKIAVSFPETRSVFGPPAVVTGNPIRREVFFKIVSTPELRRFLADLDKPLIYVTGGGQGAHAINVIVEQVLPQLLSRYSILHQTGGSRKTRDFERLSIRRLHLRRSIRRRYMVVKTVGVADIGGVLHRARLIIGRAGANTAWEIACLGKQSILIPLPKSAGGEQEKHAQWLSRAGIATVIEQSRLTPALLVKTVAARIEQHTRPLAGLPTDSVGQLIDMIEGAVR